MRIELVILLGVASSAAWAAVSYLCYRCGYIEGTLDERRRCRETKKPRPPNS